MAASVAIESVVFGKELPPVDLTKSWVAARPLAGARRDGRAAYAAGQARACRLQSHLLLPKVMRSITSCPSK